MCTANTKANAKLRDALSLCYHPWSRHRPTMAGFQGNGLKNSPHDPHYTIATASAPLGIRTSIASLTTVIYHHHGAPRYWCVVPPTMKVKFERRLGKESSHCSQYIRHISLWITPKTLRSWDIEYHEVVQMAGELLVVLPGSYY